VVGVARCGACAWEATLTGDDQAEVDRFLTARIVEHVIEAHRAA
jgi:predicted small metal-binding protein